jgi:hypothetical protein
MLYSHSRPPIFSLECFSRLKDAHNTGRYVASTIDHGGSLPNRLHKNLEPAPANTSPEAAQIAKKAVSTDDTVKGAVEKADMAGR